MNIQLETQAARAARPLAGKVSLVTGSTSGIGLGIARALAAAGVAVVLNGFGVAAEIARTRDELAAEFGVTVGYSAADMTSPEAIAGMITVDARRTRPARRARQQCGHSIRRAARPVSGREVGRDPVDQSVIGVSHHAAGFAGDAAEQVRADHQHRVRARAGRLSLQGGLRRGQAWHRRPDQGHGAGDRRRRHHLQRDLPGLRLYPAGRGPDRQPGQGARDSREKVIHDVLLAQQPNKHFASVEELGALRCFSPATPRRRLPASPCRSTAAGPHTEA